MRAGWRPTHLEKVFFPGDGITKGDLLAYYDAVSAAILPHIADRPLNLERFPDGITGHRIHQKQVPANASSFVRTVAIYAPTSRRTITYAVGGSRLALAYLVNLGCVELHPWGSRIDRLDAPDAVVFDLDPREVELAAVMETALVVRAALESRGLRSHVKTSGGRGLHVVVPMQRGPDAGVVRAFADAVAAEVASAHPRLVTASRRERDKASRVFIDTLRNGWAQTTIAPYSVRARLGAPVSTPIAWEEVTPGLDPSAFTLRTVPGRLAALGDLFQPVLTGRQRLPA